MSQSSDILGDWSRKYRRDQDLIEESDDHGADNAAWHHGSENQNDETVTVDSQESRCIVSVHRNHSDDSDDEDEHKKYEEITVETVLIRIESLAVSIVDALDQNRMPVLEQYRRPFSIQAMTASSKTLTKHFNMHQCRSFTSILLVVAYCHSLLQSQPRRTTTTREVYYFYVTHFRSQRECDLAIWDACQLLGVPRHALGLQAGSRGWFCGDVELRSVNSGELVWDAGRSDASSAQGCPVAPDWLLPPAQRSFTVAPHTTATCILVVEKEGIYQRLVQDQFWHHHRCILVTGKGFPDLATRACVHFLHHHLQLPVRGLADCDPFGVLVLHCYSHGANSADGVDGRGDRYKVPMEWVGLRPSQVRHLSSSSNTISDDDDESGSESDIRNSHSLPPAVFQELTTLDRKRLQDTLLDEEHPFTAANCERRWDELQDMLESKVELEALHWLGMDFCGAFVGHLLEHHEAQQHRKQQALLPLDDKSDDDNDYDDPDTEDNEGGWKDII